MNSSAIIIGIEEFLFVWGGKVGIFVEFLACVKAKNALWGEARLVGEWGIGAVFGDLTKWFRQNIGISTPVMDIYSGSIIDNLLGLCYNSGNNQRNVIKHLGDCAEITSWWVSRELNALEFLHTGVIEPSDYAI